MFFTEKVVIKTVVTYPIRDCPWCGIKPDIIVEDSDIDKGTIMISLQCINGGCMVDAITYSPILYKQKEELFADLRNYLQFCIINWNKNPRAEIYTSELEVCYEELIDDIRENRY